MSFYYPIKLKAHRTIIAGASFVRHHVRLRHAVSTVLSFAVIGMCHVMVAAFAYSAASSNARMDLSDMSKPQMYRYALSVQSAAANNPDRILSLTAQDVRLILASPDLDRRDGAGAVWQYRTASCVLDVFMAENEIRHYEFRSRRLGDETAVDASACLKDLYAARREQIAKAFEDIFASYGAAKDAG